jgi:hypothetical protein
VLEMYYWYFTANYPVIKAVVCVERSGMLIFEKILMHMYISLILNVTKTQHIQ